jgi:hypothetical protein
MVLCFGSIWVFQGSSKPCWDLRGVAVPQPPVWDSNPKAALIGATLLIRKMCVGVDGHLVSNTYYSRLGPGLFLVIEVGS